MLTEASLHAGSEGASVPWIDGVPAGAPAVLDRLLASSAALRFVSLSTVDGRPIAAVGRVADIAAARVAAMTSALLGLSETFAKEVTHSRCAYTTITAEDGIVVVVRVPARRPFFALSAGSDANDNLAIVLRRTLDAAQSLAPLLDAARD